MPKTLVIEPHPPAAAATTAAGQGPTPRGPAIGGGGQVSIADEAMIARVRAGDAAAADVLVRRYAEPLMRYLRRLAGEDQAEELHQQTWLSVLNNLDKFDPAAGGGGGSAGPFKAWLFRIATNKANDLWRSRGRERAAKQGLRLVTEQLAPWAGEKAEASEDGRRLREAIDRLPEGQKQVLALRYYADMKFVDIAKLLGCPLNTALGRVHKATIKLRQLLADGQDAERAR